VRVQELEGRVVGEALAQLRARRGRGAIDVRGHVLGDELRRRQHLAGMRGDRDRTVVDVDLRRPDGGAAQLQRRGRGRRQQRRDQDAAQQADRLAGFAMTAEQELRNASQADLVDERWGSRPLPIRYRKRRARAVGCARATDS
jgi:hypothetical protein